MILKPLYWKKLIIGRTVFSITSKICFVLLGFFIWTLPSTKAVVFIGELSLVLIYLSTTRRQEWDYFKGFFNY